MSAPRITSRRQTTRHALAMLLALALAVRALVPLGFMPTVDVHGAIALMFCEGYAPTPTATAPTRDAHHTHHVHGGAGHRTAHTSCPFAASGGATPPPAPLPLYLPAARFLATARQPSREPVSRRGFRAHAPRGPPSLY